MKTYAKRKHTRLPDYSALIRLKWAHVSSSSGGGNHDDVHKVNQDLRKRKIHKHTDTHLPRNML